MLRHIATLLIVLLSAPTLAASDPRAAAESFGRALTAGDAAEIRPLLPGSGKIQLQLDKLGPERGHFSAAQVEALLHDFLVEGSVRSFEIRRLEIEGSVALVHAEVVLNDRRGQSARVALHLSFRPEERRWVLREIRETPP